MPRAQANLLLMAAAALWGFGNVAQKTVLEHLDPFSAVRLGVGSTALAFGFQTIAQRYTPATHAAVTVSAEGVFGAAAASVFLGERISMLALLDAALMLAAIVRLAFGSAVRDATEQSATRRKWLGSRFQRARIVNSIS